MAAVKLTERCEIVWTCPRRNKPHSTTSNFIVSTLSIIINREWRWVGGVFSGENGISRRRAENLPHSKERGDQSLKFRDGITYIPILYTDDIAKLRHLSRCLKTSDVIDTDSEIEMLLLVTCANSIYEMWTYSKNNITSGKQSNVMQDSNAMTSFESRSLRLLYLSELKTITRKRNFFFWNFVDSLYRHDCIWLYLSFLFDKKKINSKVFAAGEILFKNSRSYDSMSLDYY